MNSWFETGRHWLHLLILAGALLFSAGCTTVDVINLSELRARVLIQLPDSTSGTSRAVPAGGSTSTFSTTGGSVTIQTVPDGEYRKLLDEVRAEIQRRLFEEGASLTAIDVSRLTQRLSDIDEAVEQLANSGTACTVNAPDFSAVTAILSYDSASNKWQLSCSVSSSD